MAWDIRGNGKTVLRGGISRMSSFPAIGSLAQQTPFGSTLCSTTSTITSTGPQCDSAAAIVVDNRGTVLSQHSATTLTGVTLNWTPAGPVFPTGSSGSVCSTNFQCSTGAVDPDFKRPKSLQWNMDIQQAITRGTTRDVAYVGNHGYDETYSLDINGVPVGTAWDATRIANCVTSAINCTSAATRTAQATLINNARPFHTPYPYLNYIVRTKAGLHSNYNALQVTLDQRNFHGRPLPCVLHVCARSRLVDEEFAECPADR